MFKTIDDRESEKVLLHGSRRAIEVEASGEVALAAEQAFALYMEMTPELAYSCLMHNKLVRMQKSDADMDEPRRRASKDKACLPKVKYDDFNALPRQV